MTGAIRFWWARPWLWRALLARRRAQKASDRREAARRMRRQFGCTCGRAVQGSPGSKGRRAFRRCPALGCSRMVAEHFQAASWWGSV